MVLRPGCDIVQIAERLHQQLRSRSGQSITQLDCCLFRMDWRFPLEQNVSGIEARVDLHGSDASHGLAVRNGPLDGSRATVLRQQRSVYVNDPPRRNIED